MATLNYQEVPKHKVVSEILNLPLSVKLSDSDAETILDYFRNKVKNHSYKVYYCRACGTMHVIYNYFLNYNIIANLYFLYWNEGVLNTKDLSTIFDKYYSKLPRHSSIYTKYEDENDYKHIYKLISAKTSFLVNFGFAEVKSADYIDDNGKKRQNNLYTITEYGKEFVEGKLKAPIAIGYTDRHVFDIPKNEDKLVTIWDVIHCKYKRFTSDSTEKDRAEATLKHVDELYIFIDDRETPSMCPNYAYEFSAGIILDYLINKQQLISYKDIEFLLTKIPIIDKPDTLIYGLMKYFKLRFCKYTHKDGNIYYGLLSKSETNLSPIMSETELEDNIHSLGKKWSKSYMEADYDEVKHIFSYKYFDGNKKLIYGAILKELTKKLREDYDI